MAATMRTLSGRTPVDALFFPFFFFSLSFFFISFVLLVFSSRWCGELVSEMSGRKVQMKIKPARLLGSRIDKRRSDEGREQGEEED